MLLSIAWKKQYYPLSSFLKIYNTYTVGYTWYKWQFHIIRSLHQMPYHKNLIITIPNLYKYCSFSYNCINYGLYSFLKSFVHKSFQLRVSKISSFNLWNEGWLHYQAWQVCQEPEWGSTLWREQQLGLWCRLILACGKLQPWKEFEVLAQKKKKTQRSIANSLICDTIQKGKPMRLIRHWRECGTKAIMMTSHNPKAVFITTNSTASIRDRHKGAHEFYHSLKVQYTISKAISSTVFHSLIVEMMEVIFPRWVQQKIILHVVRI